MTIDNIDFSKLKPYNKSQYQSFELLWYLICKEEYKHGHFTPIDDSGGGDGVESYLTLDNGDVWGWQCKFFDRFSENGRKGQVKASLKKACEVHGKSLKKWSLCTLSNLTPKENRWFTNELKTVIPTECSELKLIHYGDSFLKPNGLKMIWLVWGEKDHAGRPLLFEKFKQLVDYVPKCNSSN